MNPTAEASANAAIGIVGRLPMLKFWKTMHGIAVSAAVGFSESTFAQLQEDMSGIEDEPWQPHVQAVLSEAARIRSRLV